MKKLYAIILLVVTFTACEKQQTKPSNAVLFEANYSKVTFYSGGVTSGPVGSMHIIQTGNTVNCYYVKKSNGVSDTSTYTGEVNSMGYAQLLQPYNDGTIEYNSDKCTITIWLKGGGNKSYIYCD